MGTQALKNSVLSFIKSFNFIIVLYVSIISAVTIRKIGNSQAALMFLNKVNALPPVPEKMLFSSIGFFVLLMILMDIHDRYEIKHQWYMIIAELVCTVVVIAALQVNYNSVILLLAAHLIKYFEGNSRKLLLLIFGSAFF